MIREFSVQTFMLYSSWKIDIEENCIRSISKNLVKDVRNDKAEKSFYHINRSIGNKVLIVLDPEIISHRETHRATKITYLSLKQRLLGCTKNRREIATRVPSLLLLTKVVRFESVITVSTEKYPRRVWITSLGKKQRGSKNKRAAPLEAKNKRVLEDERGEPVSQPAFSFVGMICRKWKETKGGIRFRVGTKGFREKVIAIDSITKDPSAEGRWSLDGRSNVTKCCSMFSRS